MNASIIARFILKGELELLTPLIIGSGKNEDDVDTCIIRDYRGWPFIPATSLVGFLKHLYEDTHNSYGNWDKKRFQEQKRYFWGGTWPDNNLNKSTQSALIMDDAIIMGERFNIRVRDGVCINSQTGTALDTGKYDYEVLEPGVKFAFSCEVIIRGEFEKDYFRDVLIWIAYAMNTDDFALGAMTMKGFGKMRLNDWIVDEFDFKNEKDVWAWLNKEVPEQQYNNSNTKLSEQLGLKNSEADNFSIDAYFNIRTSLIIRDYDDNPQAPDSVHIKSNENHVLPGTSVRGAIRSRGERILKSLGSSDQSIIYNLFGWVDNEKRPFQFRTTEKAIRGKISIAETIIYGTNEEIQKRVSIDRFTGGARDGALFDSMPLWPKRDVDNNVHIKIHIKSCKDWEAGLMLLVLKDLWTGDLPVGGEKGIGRGRLEGQKATINWNNQRITLASQDDYLMLKSEGNPNIWDEDAAEKLENLVSALIYRINNPEVNVQGGAKNED